jgi:hypothetical protein
MLILQSGAENLNKKGKKPKPSINYLIITAKILEILFYVAQIGAVLF